MDIFSELELIQNNSLIIDQLGINEVTEQPAALLEGFGNPILAETAPAKFSK